MTPWLMILLVVLAALLLAAGVALVWRARRSARRARAGEVTRLPVVLVHGFMGFDELAVPGFRPHYFRGVAAHLERRGVKVYRPRLPGIASVPERAARLAAYVRALPEPKVNLIAHSMGGLDARYAIARLGLGERVASLTTIATPHRGTPVADLGQWAPARAARAVAKKVGIGSDAIDWLTAERLASFNQAIADDPRVVYGCVVAKTSARAVSWNPAILASHLWVRRRAGSNDGLVPVDSQRWGECVCEVDADHWAQVGWSMRFDAPALYDQIVARLAARGL